jgi:hypothetical protein
MVVNSSRASCGPPDDPDDFFADKAARYPSRPAQNRAGATGYSLARRRRDFAAECVACLLEARLADRRHCSPIEFILENAIGHRGHGDKQEGHREMRRRNRNFGSHLAGESKLSETSRPSLSL